MSWLSPASEVVTGWLSSGYAGHGILGADIPSTGDNGGSPVLNDSISPTAEYRWTVETPPASGTLSVFEDCSFEYDNATAGTYNFVYRLYEDGVSQGTATVTLQIGAAETTITATTANAVGSLASYSTVSCTIAATTANAVGSLASGVGTVCTITATTANASGSLISQSAATSFINATTAQVVGALVSRSLVESMINGTTADAVVSLVSSVSARSVISAMAARCTANMLSVGYVVTPDDPEIVLLSSPLTRTATLTSILR